MALKLKGSTSGFVGLDAPSVAGNNTLILPENSGSAFQVFANDITAGVTTFTTVTVNRNGDLTVPGTISIGGTLTYEDVTSVDSIGIVTARGLSIFGNTTGLNVTGVGTFVNGSISLTSGGAERLNIASPGGGHVLIKNPSAAYLAFGTNNEERVRVEADGDVGIGTATVIADAHVHILDTGTGGYRPLVVEGSATNGSVIEFRNNGASKIRIGSGGANNLSGSSVDDGLIRSEANMLFAVGNSEKVRIDSSGRLLVGAAAIQYHNSPFYASGTGPVIGAFHSSSGGTNDQARIALGALANNPPYNRGVYLTAENNGAGHDFIVACSASHSAGPSEKLRIDSSGRLLLGTTTEGSAGADEFTINTASGHGGMTIRNDTSSNGNIWFSDGTSGAAEYAGYVQYAHNGDHMIFGTNGSEKVRITSNGNLGLGLNAPTAASSETTLHIYANEYPEVHLTSSVTGSNAGDGSIFTLNNDSSTIIRNQENSYIRFDTNGSNERMRILAGGGLTFNGDTAAANALDDYEEGDWTPSYGSSAVPSSSYNVTGGRYTRVGRLVTVTGRIQMSSSTVNGNTLTMGGFPFTASVTNFPGGLTFTYNDNFLSATGSANAQLSFLLVANTQYGYFYDGDGNTVAANGTYDSARRTLHFFGSYETDA